MATRGRRAMNETYQVGGRDAEDCGLEVGDRVPDWDKQLGSVPSVPEFVLTR